MGTYLLLHIIIPYIKIPLCPFFFFLPRQLHRLIEFHDLRIIQTNTLPDDVGEKMLAEPQPLINVVDIMHFNVHQRIQELGPVVYNILQVGKANGVLLNHHQKIKLLMYSYNIPSPPTYLCLT